MDFTNRKAGITISLYSRFEVNFIMKGKHLSLKQRLLVAATLFGMFFGAGNLIFPVHLGQLAGHNLVPATVGFILTAVGLQSWRALRLLFYLPALLNHRPVLCHSAVCYHILYHRHCPNAGKRGFRTYDTVSFFCRILRPGAAFLPAAGKYYTLDW